MTRPPITPRFELEDVPVPRLEPELLPVVEEPRAGMGSAALALAGVSVLGVGLALLSTGNFVADQFTRASWLGWTTLAVAAGGAGLIGSAIWREMSFLRRLDAVDTLRTELADPMRAKAAARRWLHSLPHSADVLPAIEATDSPEAITALLRAGPDRVIVEQAQALGRAAAVQVLAVTAAVPSPTLDGVVVTLRGVRLVRQVAQLYGYRPGTIGTIALLRRTLFSGVFVTGTNVAVDTLVKAAVSNPALQHLVGDVAGAGVAARRMIVLARATAAACSPVSPEG